jgi:hypothetical protein
MNGLDMQGARDDRILYWPVVLTVAWPLLFVLVCFIASLFTWAGLFALFFLPLQALVLTLWGASVFLLVCCAWSGRTRGLGVGFCQRWSWR